MNLPYAELMLIIRPYGSFSPSAKPIHHPICKIIWLRKKSEGWLFLFHKVNVSMYRKIDHLRATITVSQNSIAYQSSSSFISKSSGLFIVFILKCFLNHASTYYGNKTFTSNKMRDITDYL